MTSLYTSGRKLLTFEKGRKRRLRRLQPRITKIVTYIRTDILINHTRYDVTNYFRSEAAAQKPSKMPPQTASCGISGARFKRGSPNFTRLSGTTGPTNQLDMTSLVNSGFCKMQFYFRSAFTEVRKTAENTASDGFESNFSGAVFCVACPTN